MVDISVVVYFTVTVLCLQFPCCEQGSSSCIIFSVSFYSGDSCMHGLKKNHKLSLNWKYNCGILVETLPRTLGGNSATDV